MCFLIGCSKDKDTTKPTVEIHSPQNGLIINGIDTIQVLATIFDDITIKSVSVSLINDNDIPVLNSISKKPDTKNYDLNVSYFFNDNQLPSGQYHLRVKADDGENVHAEYIVVNYNEPAREREGVFVVSNSASWSHFYLLDGGYSASLFKSIAGDYLNAEVNSATQQIVYASSKTGAVSATDIITLGSDWSIPISNSSSVPYYTGSYYHNNNLYLGRRDGFIEAFNQYGSPKFSSVGHSGFYAESMLIDDEFLITEEQSVVLNDVRLLYYPLGSGIIYKTTDVNTKDIKGIYKKDFQTIILLANNFTNTGEILWYDIVSGGITDPYNVNIGKIEASMELSAGVYLVAESGNLTILNTNSFSKTAYINGIGATNFWYDAFANELFVGSGNVLSVYDFSSKLLKGTYTHGSQVKDVTFWYNR
ncbi:MAG: Ig-like domain-containing protein [Vicingaceae bacterium]